MNTVVREHAVVTVRCVARQTFVKVVITSFSAFESFDWWTPSYRRPIYRSSKPSIKQSNNKSRANSIQSIQQNHSKRISFVIFLLFLKINSTRGHWINIEMIYFEFVWNTTSFRQDTSPPAILSSSHENSKSHKFQAHWTNTRNIPGHQLFHNKII